MASLCWSDKHTASMEGERGELTKSLAQGTHAIEKFSNVSDNFPWVGRHWVIHTVNASHTDCFQLHLALALWIANDLWLHKFSPLVRKKLTEHKAELLPQMPLYLWILGDGPPTPDLSGVPHILSCHCWPLPCSTYFCTTHSTEWAGT